MKVTLITKDFSKVLSVSSRFVANRANLPILGNIILKAEKTKLQIKATDLEVSLCATLGAKVEEDGEIALPSKTFTEIISNLGSENVLLDSNQEIVTVSGEGFTSKVNALNTSDYPKLTTELSESALHVQTRVFVPALNKVLFSTSTDEARPQLTGVLFLFRKNEMILVATDGFRLSQKKCNVETSLEDQQIIIPRRVLSEIPRLATSAEVLLELKPEEKEVVFGLPNMVMGSRLIEGEFPNYERIMPKATKVTVNVSKEELTRAVKLASIFARDNANTIQLSIQESELVVSAESNRSGQEQLSIPAKVEGEQMNLSFNYRYIEELLAVIGGESVEIKANDALTACLFLDPKDASFLHLIMPVRV